MERKAKIKFYPSGFVVTDLGEYLSGPEGREELRKLYEWGRHRLHNEDPANTHWRSTTAARCGPSGQEP